MCTVVVGWGLNFRKFMFVVWHQINGRYSCVSLFWRVRSTPYKQAKHIVSSKKSDEVMPEKRISFLCASTEAHSAFLQRESRNLLTLSETYTVRVFSHNETDLLHEREHPRQSPINRDADHNFETSSLDVSKIFECLETRWLGKVLVYVDVVDSTQNVLKNMLSGWSGRHGMVATTVKQTSGRGRRGTSWTSPFGSVSLTLALRLDQYNPYTNKGEDMNRLVFLQYIAALAVCDVALAHPQWRKDLAIKWPNDVYAGGQKVAGVLCEASINASNYIDVFVGVGVNVCNKSPTTCLYNEIEAQNASPQINSMNTMREVFIGQFVTAFEKAYDEFCCQGFHGRLQARYLQLWMHDNQEVRIGGANGPKAVVKGLAPNGWVRVLRMDWDAFQDLPPESTSLDVSQNVMHEKAAR